MQSKVLEVSFEIEKLSPHEREDMVADSARAMRAYYLNDNGPLARTLLQGLSKHGMTALVQALVNEGEKHGVRIQVPESSTTVIAAPAIQWDLSETEKALIETGRITAAVKSIRDRHGISLKDAKDTHDLWRDYARRLRAKALIEAATAPISPNGG